MKHISKSKSTTKINIKNKNEISNEDIKINKKIINIPPLNIDRNSRNNKKLSYSINEKI